MELDNEKVKAAARKIEEVCLNCKDHKLTCYVAVAKRAVATLVKDEQKAGGTFDENLD